MWLGAAATTPETEVLTAVWEVCVCARSLPRPGPSSADFCVRLRFLVGGIAH